MSRSFASLTRRTAMLGAGAVALAPARANAQLQDGPAILAGRQFLCALVVGALGDGRIFRILRPGLRFNGRALDWDTPFRVASISKLFTAFGATTLVAEGRLSLDEDVADRLGPAFRHPAHPNRPITPRALMSHTSGLRNGADFPVPAGQSFTARLARAAQEQDYGGWFAPADAPPGWFSYSDANSAVLAQLIEAVTGQRFDLFMTERVFARSRAPTVGYNWSGVPQDIRDAAMAGARFEGGAWTAQVDAAVPPWPAIPLYRGEASAAPDPASLPLAQNGFAFAPHGGLRASLNNLTAHAWLHAGNGSTGVFQSLAPAYRLMGEGPAWTYTPQNPNGDTDNGFFQSYGLGPQRLTGVSGPGYGDALFGDQSHEWIGHAGDAYGWITGMWWNVRTRAVLTYAINGVPERDRVPGRRSAFLAAEEELMDEALDFVTR